MAANRPTSRPGLALVSADGGLDALQSEWDELLEHSDQGAFFLRWRWNRSWWRMYAPAGSRLYLVLFRDSSRRLDGLAPLFWQQSRHWGLVRPRVLQFLGTGIDVLTSEYLDVIARRGHEPAD